MKVKKIIPCVCIDHYPETADYGMPDIAVGQGVWFSCYCRNCGRGGRWLDHTTSYKALRNWNEMQKGLWRERCYKPWVNEYKDNIEPWEIGVMEDFVNA